MVHCCAVGPLPAQQRLQRDDPPTVQRVDRLVAQFDLAAFEAAGHVGGLLVLRRLPSISRRVI